MALLFLYTRQQTNLETYILTSKKTKTMKKIILSTAIVLGGLTAVTAQNDKEATAMTEQPQTAVEAQVENRLDAAQDVKTIAVEKKAATEAAATDAVQEYKEVKPSELPQAVKDAAAADFDGATISKAYVNAQGDYKIELATADAKQATVYANAKGEWIKNELKKQ